jgi:hypothetical protein
LLGGRLSPVCPAGIVGRFKRHRLSSVLHFRASGKMGSVELSAVFRRRILTLCAWQALIAS